MRSIETAEKREVRDKRNRMVIGIVLIVLMVSSTIGFIFAFGGGNVSNGSNNEIEPDFSYNGFDFFKVGNKIRFQTLDWVFETSLEPKETESLDFDFPVTAQDFFNKPVYIVYDKRTSAIEELERNLYGISLRVSPTCLEGRECNNEGSVIKTCEDNVILISESEEIKTYKEGNCIFLDGPKDKHLLLVDRLIYKILGIQ